MCWVFDVSPSKLGPVKWGNSFRDIEIRTKLKIGEKQAGIVQDYQTLISVVSEVFGGKPKQENPSPSAATPRNGAELTAAFNSVFGHG